MAKAKGKSASSAKVTFGKRKTGPGSGQKSYNKPKRTPSHPTKSHAVLAKEGDKEKLIRFGQKGVSGDKSSRFRFDSKMKKIVSRITEMNMTRCVSLGSKLAVKERDSTSVNTTLFSSNVCSLT